VSEPSLAPQALPAHTHCVSDTGLRDDQGKTARSRDVHIRTFLIADIRGYTRFTQERGDEAAAKLVAKFAEIAREIVEARAGSLLELRGDEALCVFSSAREAIRAAVDLQQRFVDETIDQPELPCRVGIGLDAGEAIPVEGGYRGGALNLAARLCGQAQAGEILASREVTHLARHLDGVRYVDRGPLMFKGIADPTVVVRVVPEGADPVDQLRPFAPTASAPARTSRRWAMVGVTILILALVAISIPVLSSGDGATDVDIATNSVARINAQDGDLELTPTALGQRPGASAIGFGSLWVVLPDSGKVARLDLDDGAVIQTIRVGTSPSGIAFGGGSVWVTNSGDGTVSRVNVDTNEETETLDAGTGPTGIAYGADALWVADTLGSELLRIDPLTGESRPVPVAGQPNSVAFTPEGVWVSVAPESIYRVDTSDTSVTLTQQVGTGPTAVISQFGFIWVANQLDGTVTKLRPSSGTVLDTIPVDEGPNALAAAGDSVWVANEFADSITAIDVDGNTEQRTFSVGAAAASLAADGDALWIAVGASAATHRGGTLSIVSTGEAPSSLDPAFSALNGEVEGQILSLTNDGLLTFKKVTGADGSTLVPDLAAALPEVSPDGLSYRFALREGIRYSTGEPVLSEDFRYAIERSFALNDDGAWLLFSTLDGAQACHAEPSTCDLSHAIEVDQGSVTFHLQTPDPDFPFKLVPPLGHPLPSTVPVEDQGHDATPATGPYMIDEASPDEMIKLVRNPEFEEWSAVAQPDGYVDRISWRFEQEAASALEAVMAAESDLLIDPEGEARPDDLAELEAAHPDRIVRVPQGVALYLGFDMRVPPFNDVRVRRALNLALDRGRLVDLAGGPNVQRPACQIFPPSIQGYEPFCPYTVAPESDVWSAPDFVRAQALIEGAGAVGDEITVWASSEGLPTSLEVMPYVVSVLEDLGMRPHYEIIESFDEYWAGVRRGEPNVYFSAWASSHPPAAGGWIDEEFRCLNAGSIPVLCTADFEEEVASAHELQATDPAAAIDAWTQIEHGLVEDAVWAPLMIDVSTFAMSESIENVQVHTQWGILLSRVWVQ
jgi:YVTN family beta-propeller protein